MRRQSASRCTPIFAVESWNIPVDKSAAVRWPPGNEPLQQHGAARKCADLLDNKWKIRIACAQGACASRGPSARERKSVRSSAELRRQSRRGGQLVRPLCFKLGAPPPPAPVSPQTGLAVDRIAALSVRHRVTRGTSVQVRPSVARASCAALRRRRRRRGQARCAREL